MPEITLLYLIKQVELAVRNRLDAVVAPEGLTALQYTALTVLERRPGLTSSDLARNSFVRAQTMAQMVADLERRGLIARVPDPANRRLFRAALTPEGAAVLERLRAAVSAVEDEMVAGLDRERVELFRAALHASRAALSGRAPH